MRNKSPYFRATLTRQHTANLSFSYVADIYIGPLVVQFISLRFMGAYIQAEIFFLSFNFIPFFLSLRKNILLNDIIWTWMWAHFDHTFCTFLKNLIKNYKRNQIWNI